eukprot:GHVT01038320.1.p1 GENE.GHVT01038320.1~~GHVT01038320.1.p1  ORF type:complete len:142 (-),score=1.20 GHVT01038320.1:11-436(-)
MEGLECVGRQPTPSESTEEYSDDKSVMRSSSRASEAQPQDADYDEQEISGAVLEASNSVDDADSLGNRDNDWTIGLSLVTADDRHLFDKLFISIVKILAPYWAWQCVTRSAGCGAGPRCLPYVRVCGQNTCTHNKSAWGPP